MSSNCARDPRSGSELGKLLPRQLALRLIAVARMMARAGLEISATVHPGVQPLRGDSLRFTNGCCSSCLRVRVPQMYRGHPQSRECRAHTT